MHIQEFVWLHFNWVETLWGWDGEEGVLWGPNRVMQVVGVEVDLSLHVADLYVLNHKYCLLL